MIVLKRNKVLQEIIGLGGYEDRNLSIKTRQSICINLYRYMNNAKVATELMFCAAIYVIVLSSLFTVIRNCDTVRGFYFDIEDLANSSKTLRNDNYYPKAEADIHAFTKKYRIITMAGSVVYGLVPFMVVIYCLEKDTYTLDKWTLHYNNVWLPFDLNTAGRFIGVNVVQSASCCTARTVLIMIISMYFGIIHYIRAFVLDSVYLFDEMDNLAETDDSNLLIERMESLIDFHVSILDLSNRLGKMMRFVIFVTFTPSVLSICGSMFRGQSGSEHMEFSEVYGACFSSCYILTVLFLFCYFGNILTSSLLGVAATADSSEWYIYPHRVQLYVAFMIRCAQKFFSISAYGMMPCTLENFLKVMNSAVSAYTVMRKFS